jgi:hypothetical protein
MPSSMIHLLAAYKYDPKSSVAFFIGNIVPDIISEWKEKDRSHFRDRKDRLNALKELANTININDDFNRGVLLHLYLDYKWDTYPMKKFKEGFEKDTWFRPYRYEISLAGAWLYHNRDWSKDLWEKIISCPMTSYENNFGYEKEDIYNFLSRSYKWHRDNKIGPSLFFTPDFIEVFTDNVVNEFKDWLDNFK